MPDDWARHIYPRLFSNLEFLKQPIAWPAPIQSVSVDLWPSGGRVEPDVMVALSSSESVIRLIVETKWNSGFSDWQPIRQWESFHGGISHWHILIVRDLRSAESQIEIVQSETKAGSIDPLMEKRIGALTWHQLSLNLRNFGDDVPQPLRFWASQAAETLALFGERTFSGFKAGQTEIAPHVSSLQFDNLCWTSRAIELAAEQWRPTKGVHNG